MKVIVLELPRRRVRGAALSNADVDSDVRPLADVKVSEGWVTLKGNVIPYESDAASRRGEDEWVVLASHGSRSRRF